MNRQSNNGIVKIFGGMSMRRRWIKFCVTVIIIGCLVIYCYPQSMKQIMQCKSSMFIVCTIETLVDGTPSSVSDVYLIPKQSDCYVQLMDLCSKYTFHRYYKTLITTNFITIKERGIDFNFHIYPNPINTDEIYSIGLYGDGRVFIGQRLYKMDYIGNKKQTKFMIELKSILEDHKELLTK